RPLSRRLPDDSLPAGGLQRVALPPLRARRIRLRGTAPLHARLGRGRAGPADPCRRPRAPAGPGAAGLALARPAPRLRRDRAAGGDLRPLPALALAEDRRRLGLRPRAAALAPA